MAEFRGLRHGLDNPGPPLGRQRSLLDARRSGRYRRFDLVQRFAEILGEPLSDAEYQQVIWYLEQGE